MFFIFILFSNGLNRYFYPDYFIIIIFSIDVNFRLLAILSFYAISYIYNRFTIYNFIQ